MHVFLHACVCACVCSCSVSVHVWRNICIYLVWATHLLTVKSILGIYLNVLDVLSIVGTESEMCLHFDAAT